MALKYTRVVFLLSNTALYNNLSRRRREVPYHVRGHPHPRCAEAHVPSGTARATRGHKEDFCAVLDMLANVKNVVAADQ